MIKGGNVGLAALSEDTGSVILSLGWGTATGEGDADVSVLLLNASGKVRGARQGADRRRQRGPHQPRSDG